MTVVSFYTQRKVRFNEIGSLIYSFRTHRRMSMEALGAAVGCSTGHISKIESGANTPSLELLDRMFDVLNIRLTIEDTAA